jgi:hypothetical protein
MNRVSAKTPFAYHDFMQSLPKMNMYCTVARDTDIGAMPRMSGDTQRTTLKSERVVYCSVTTITMISALREESRPP